MVLKNGRPILNSLASCDSLENGADVLYNRIRSTLNAEQDILINLMHNLKLTAEQAMDAVGIPENEQPKYLALIEA